MTQLGLQGAVLFFLGRFVAHLLTLLCFPVDFFGIQETFMCPTVALGQCSQSILIFYAFEFIKSQFGLGGVLASTSSLIVPQYQVSMKEELHSSRI